MIPIIVQIILVTFVSTFSSKDFINFFEREREHKQRGGVEEEGEGETDSLLSGVPNAGLDPKSLRS